jgi:hypothetical protein
VAALDGDVDQRIGDDVELGFRHQRDQLAEIVVVDGMQRGEVGAGDTALQAQAHRLRRQRLHMARQRIVALIAMHVYHQAALGRDLAEGAHGGGAVGQGALEMGNAADHIDAAVQRQFQQFHRARRTVIAILREGHELQVQIGRDLFLHLEQGIDRQQPRIADVHMAAHRQQPLRHRPVAIGQGPLRHRLLGQLRLQFAPELDAFQQGAGLVQPRQAERQRRVHMEMGINERRRNQPSRRVDLLRALRSNPRLCRDDSPILDTDIDSCTAIRQIAAANYQVHHLSPFRYGTISARG